MGVLSVIGRVSMATAFPVIALARAQISAVVGIVLPSISAQLAGALRLSASIGITPPSIAASAALAAKILAAIQVAIAPPQIDFAASACADLIAKLTLQEGALNAALSWGLYPGIVSLYSYRGKLSDLGSTVTQVMAAGGNGPIPLGENVVGVLILTNASDTIATASLSVIVKM